MHRQERRRKFNEAVVNLLYPPPPPPLPSESTEEGIPALELKGDEFRGADDPGDSDSSSESDKDGEVGDGERKLTRAQRKRIRKKKLREESVSRGKLIGPSLPSINNDEPCNIQKVETSDVRRNAQEDSAAHEHQGDAAASTKTRRLNHRRMKKRLAKNVPTSSNRTEDE